MITELLIKNYKSILQDKIQFSNVNVFIGENGSGKTNYLEAVAMLSAANSDRMDISGLIDRGIRVTKPNLTLSSFSGNKTKNNISFDIVFKSENKSERLSTNLIPTNTNDINTSWEFYIKENKYTTLEISEFIAYFIKIKGIDKNIEDLEKQSNIKKFVPFLKLNNYTKKFLIYNLDTQALRGINNNSKTMPLGIYGEGLDVLLNDFSKEEWEELMEYNHLISWLDDIVIDKSDKLKFEGHKLGRSTSILYFRDKYMRKNNNVFAAENSNEGVLHILFYLALFISKKTPKFFAIDNIETALNPKLCRTLMKEIAKLAIKHDKQVLITTHNPAVLDGLNLYDDKQRLFVIKRTDEGHTKSERIKLKPETKEKDLKLSEMWMRGYLGGLPTNF